MRGTIDMKYPLEFYHHGYDWQIRDAQLKPVLRIDVSRMDFINMNNAEKLCGEVVRLLNQEEANKVLNMVPESTEMASNVPIFASNGENP